MASQIPVIYRFYTFNTFLVSLPSQVITDFGLHLFLYDLWIAVHSLVLFIYSGHLYLANTNRKITNIHNKNILAFKRVVRFHIHNNIKQFLYEHNQFCMTLSQYNKFWSNIFLAFILSLIAISLMYMEQFFFEPINTDIKILIGLITFTWIALISITQLAFAYLSKRIHQTAVPLSRLQWRLNGWPFRVNNKIKLMTYFERLSSNKKIGITLGPTVAMTIPIFSQVNIKQLKIGHFYLIKIYSYFEIGCAQVHSILRLDT